MTTLTNKNIEKWVEKMREHLTIPMQPQNLFLVYTKIEWLTDPRLVILLDGMRKTLTMQIRMG